MNIPIKLIVPSGGCNAKCRFCYMKNLITTHNKINKQEFINNFIKSLFILFDKIGNDKNNITLDITGNETTLDVNLLKTILNKLKTNNIAQYVKHITLTTNGFNMLKVVDDFQSIVDYVNISVHTFDMHERYEIMKYSLTNDQYFNINNKLNNYKISSSAVSVIDQPIEKFDIWRDKFILWAKKTGFSSLRFRCDTLSFDAKIFNEYMFNTINNSKLKLIDYKKTVSSQYCILTTDDDFKIVFLHGTLSSLHIKKPIEYIVHDDGKPYYDLNKISLIK